MDNQDVTITDIKIPFSRMIVIILTWMAASIPAVLIIYFIMFLIALMFAGCLPLFY